MDRENEKLCVIVSVAAILCGIICIVFGIERMLVTIAAAASFSACVTVVLLLTAYAFKKEETKS